MKNKNNLIPINTPVFLSATFLQKKPSQWGYSRVDDPTRLALEKKLADVEKAKYALAFSSGSSAITSLLMLLKSGDHVLCHREIYEGTHRILDKIMKGFGVSFGMANFNDARELKNSMQPETRMVFFETITNPNLEVVDVARVVDTAKGKGVLIVVDNTIATPLFRNPLNEGADIVVHSLTKFISGSHDVTGGALMINDSQLFERLGFVQRTTGAILSPLSCHLVDRGIETLPLRMEKHQKNAVRIAQFLKDHPRVDKVSFPGMSGLVSFILAKGLRPKVFLKRLKKIGIAQSFGGTASTILHPGSMMTLANPVGASFFRLSVGTENIDELIGDLKAALK